MSLVILLTITIFAMFTGPRLVQYFGANKAAGIVAAMGLVLLAL